MTETSHRVLAGRTITNILLGVAMVVVFVGAVAGRESALAVCAGILIECGLTALLVVANLLRRGLPIGTGG